MVTHDKMFLTLWLRAPETLSPRPSGTPIHVLTFALSEPFTLLPAFLAVSPLNFKPRDMCILGTHCANITQPPLTPCRTFSGRGV